MQTAYCFIDLADSRTRFTEQAQTLQLLQHFADTLNHHFPALLTPFAIKDGDGLLGGFSADDQAQIVDVYPFCNAYLKSDAFQTFWQTHFAGLAEPTFYFGVGLGTMTTPSPSDYQDINRVNGTAIVNALAAADQAKLLRQGAELAQGYPFMTTAFQFQLVADQPAANGINALFYLIYEQLLNTQLRKDAFAEIVLQPTLKRYELAELLWTKYGVASYELDYSDQKGRALASSKVSRLLNQIQYPLIEQTLATLRAQLMTFKETVE